MTRTLLTCALLAWPASVLAGDHRVPYEARHTMQRAGDPLCISKFAVPALNSKYVGYYVGGDSPCPVWAPPAHECECGEEHGESLAYLPGTFGVDFRGKPCVPRRVFLFSSFGQKRAGGYGAYRPDYHVPDPIPSIVKLVRSLHPRVHHHHHGEEVAVEGEGEGGEGH